jgi:hypothetical protein
MPPGPAPVDELQPLSGPPSPRRPTGGLTFSSTPSPDPLDELMGEGTPDLDDQLAGSPSEDESRDLFDESDESNPRSSKGSSATKALSAKAQQAAARQAVKIAGAMTHQYLARDESARAVGLYLVDDETAAQIGDPLARIAARHAGPAGAIANPDVADGIAAMLGVAKFLSITIEKSSQAAQHRANLHPAEPQQVPGL